MQIEEVCRPIILEWIIVQHERILEWTGRVFDLEVGPRNEELCILHSFLLQFI